MNDREPADISEKLDRTLLVSTRISCEIDGFPVEFSPLLRPRDVPKWLRQLRKIGGVPPGRPDQTTPNGEPYCPRHGVGMQQHGANGETWYSHALTGADGKEYWCKGRPGKDSRGWDVPIEPPR